MMTIEENDRIQAVLHTLRNSSAFAEAQRILHDFFRDERAFGLTAVRSSWQAEDLVLIRQILNEWFGDT